MKGVDGLMNRQPQDQREDALQTHNRPVVESALVARREDIVVIVKLLPASLSIASFFATTTCRKSERSLSVVAVFPKRWLQQRAKNTSVVSYMVELQRVRLLGFDYVHLVAH